MCLCGVCVSLGVFSWSVCVCVCFSVCVSLAPMNRCSFCILIGSSFGPKLQHCQIVVLMFVKRKVHSDSQTQLSWRPTQENIL